MNNREFRSAVIGMLLGVGQITEQNSLIIIHHIKQKEYIEFKKNILQTKQITIIEIIDFSHSVKIETRHKPIYRVLKKRLHKNNIKTITRSVLNDLTALGIAIWFMDSGSISIKKRDGEIHNCEIFLNTYLDKEQNQVIIDYFKEVWDISWNLIKSEKLRIGATEGRKFVNIIKQYIHESMFYKIKNFMS